MTLGMRDGQGAEVTELASERRRSSYPLVATRILNSPLMVTRTELFAVLHALAPRLGLAPLEAVDPKFLTRNPQYTSYRVLDGGIGAVPIHGALVHKSMGVADAPSGLTSYQDIQNDFDAARNDLRVQTIALVIDSPGGEVQGAFDTAQHIFEARGQGKRIVAVLDENANSAAYLIASAADEIWIPATGTAGSIGVRAVHVDKSKANEMAGLNVTEVFEGDRKNDGSPNAPLSAAALERLTAEVHDVFEMFVDAVHRYRGISAAKIRTMQSDVFRGQDAVDQGLADKVISSSNAIELLQARLQAGNGGMSMKDGKPTPTAEAGKTTDEGKPTPAAPATTAAPAAAAEGTEGKETATVHNIAEARDKAKLDLRKQLDADVKAIRLAAKNVGCEDLAASVIEKMIGEGLSLADAKELLFAEHVKKSPVITSAFSPLANGETNPLMAAVDRYIATMKHQPAATK